MINPVGLSASLLEVYEAPWLENEEALPEDML